MPAWPEEDTGAGPCAKRDGGKQVCERRGASERSGEN